MPQARGRLAWLDISLPQRGAEGLTTIIPAVFRLLTNKEVTLPAFSITSVLPSLMNGGKDFSAWSKKDDLLYKTLRLPVETVLGRDGVGGGSGRAGGRSRPNRGNSVFHTARGSERRTRRRYHQAAGRL